MEKSEGDEKKGNQRLLAITFWALVIIFLWIVAQLLSRLKKVRVPWTRRSKIPKLEKGPASIENEFENSWILKNSHLLPENILEFKKVWLLGPSGSGQTTLLELFGIQHAPLNNLDTTNGEEFLTDPTWPSTIFVKTQGLFQLSDRADIEINEQIMIEHAHQSADAIILIYPKLQRSHFDMFHQTIDKVRCARR
jgi:hypothetical protein